MHMSSSEVKPKTSFACTQRPVPKPAQSASVAQRLAAPLIDDPLTCPPTNCSTIDRPGTTPAVSSQPIFTSVVTPLSCVHSYLSVSPGLTSIGFGKRRCGGSEYASFE